MGSPLVHPTICDIREGYGGKVAGVGSRQPHAIAAAADARDKEAAQGAMLCSLSSSLV